MSADWGFGAIYLFSHIQIDDTDIIQFLFVKCEQALLLLYIFNSTGHALLS